MKVVICTGSPHSGHEQVFQLLMHAGVVAARPTNLGAQTPQSLQAQLLLNQEVDLQSSSPLTQVKPGKFWGQLAMDLFLANIKSPLWGWSDHQTAVLMDFWRDFDTQVRLVLVYQTPQEYLGQLLGQTSSPTSQDIAAALIDWMRWNTELLRYFTHNPLGCVLINSQSALTQPHFLMSSLATNWQMAGLVVNSARQTPSWNNLQHCLINKLIDPQHPAFTLIAELDCNALLPSAAHVYRHGVDMQNAAWSDWVSLRAKIMEHDQVDSNLFAGIGMQPSSDVESQTAKLQEENNLLLMQLYQVQEELEHFFLLSQESRRQQSNSVGFVTEFWRTHEPTEIRIDMRKDVVGSNWYSPESDGRWAGPGLVSSVEMPPLREGLYTLTLYVVDAMHYDIIQNMVLEALSQRISFEIESLTPESLYPLVCRAQFCVVPELSTVAWSINLRFTKLISPAEAGGDDHRQLAIRLHSLHISMNE